MTVRLSQFGLGLISLTVLWLSTQPAISEPERRQPLLRLQQCSAGDVTIGTPLERVREMLGEPDWSVGKESEGGRWVYGGLSFCHQRGLISGFMVYLTREEESEGERTDPDIRFGADPGDVSEIMGVAPAGRLENSLVYGFRACCALIELDGPDDVAYHVIVGPPPEAWAQGCENEEECQTRSELQRLCSSGPSGGNQK